jgi:hypothetical protein
MINIGNKIFPLFAPKTNEAPIKPTKDIASPPIVMLVSNQGVCFRSISSKMKNIGVLKIKGIITINQYEILFDNKMISSGMGLVSNWSNHPFSRSLFKVFSNEGIKAKIRPTHIIAFEIISKLSLMGPIPKVNRIIIKSIKLIIATRSVSERKLIKKSLLICVTNTNNQLEPFEFI